MPEFELLDLKKKLYIYHLSQAALCGRDILWDQNNRYNLRVRGVLETIWKTFKETVKQKTFIHSKYTLNEFGFQTEFIIIILPRNYLPDFRNLFDELVDLSDWTCFLVTSGKSFEFFISEIRVKSIMHK